MVWGSKLSGSGSSPETQRLSSSLLDWKGGGGGGEANSSHRLYERKKTLYIFSGIVPCSATVKVSRYDEQDQAD